MDAERIRTMLLELPHVVETMQWGANLVFWVGDKSIGGKMFALVDLDGNGGPVICYAAGPEHYAELLEQEGFLPAPYFARIHWIAVERWDAMTPQQWREELEAARTLTHAKMPRRVRESLELPPRELRRLIAEKRKSAASKSAKKR